MLKKVNQETIKDYINKHFKEIVEEAIKDQEKIAANNFDIDNTQEPGQEHIIFIESLSEDGLSLKDINTNIEKSAKFTELKKLASRFEDLEEGYDEDDVETVIVESFVSILNKKIDFFAINKKAALASGYKLYTAYNTNTHRDDYLVETTKTYDKTEYKEFACYDNQTRFCHNPANEQIIEEKSRSELNAQHSCYSRIKRTVEICKEDIQKYEQEYNFEITDSSVYNIIFAK